MTDRDTLADELLAAIDRAEEQLEAENGPLRPGYRNVVRLDHDGSGYVVSVHREPVRQVRISVAVR